MREPGVGEGEQASEAGGGRVAAVGDLGDEVREVVWKEAVGHGCCRAVVRASPLRGVGGRGRGLAVRWLSGVEASHLLATAISHIFFAGHFGDAGTSVVSSYTWSYWSTGLLAELLSVSSGDWSRSPP